MTDQPLFNPTRRGALKCLAFGAAGTLFSLSAGILTPVDLALAKAGGTESAAKTGVPLFLQISDTHIGFNKEANPDVVGTLGKTIALVNAMPKKPALMIHTGDITHLSKPAEFDTAAQLLSMLNITELHTTPGEHDVTDAAVTEYFSRYGKALTESGLLQLRPPGCALRLPHQRAELQAQRTGQPWPGAVGVARERPAGTLREHPHCRVCAHAIVDDLRTVGLGYARLGTGDELPETVRLGHGPEWPHPSDRAAVEGNITFHTARSTAYPQPNPGEGSGPGPLKVPTEQLPSMLGVSNVTLKHHPDALSLTDSTLA